MRNITVIIIFIRDFDQQRDEKRGKKRLLVGISNYFRIYAAGKKEDKGGNKDEKKATRNIRVWSNLCF